jgi:hypothetical protein
MEDMPGAHFNEAYQVTVKEQENNPVYYKETVECRHLIFWSISQGKVHSHVAKLEMNRSVSTDKVSLLDKQTFVQ